MAVAPSSLLSSTAKTRRTSSMPSQGSMSRASCCAWSASTNRPVPSCSMDFDLHRVTGLYASRNYTRVRSMCVCLLLQVFDDLVANWILTAYLPAGRRKLMLCGMATSPSSDAMPLRSATTFSSNTAGGIVIRCLQCNRRDSSQAAHCSCQFQVRSNSCPAAGVYTCVEKADQRP
jgi:hypothetical protein